MPSALHETLIEMFRQRPEFAAQMLRDVLHIALPTYTEIQVESATLNDSAPPEYRADLVILLLHNAAVFGIVVEVQLQPDPDKRFTWPAFACAARSRFKCPTCILVIAPDENVAKWAAQPVELGAGNVFKPIVFGGDAIPIVGADCGPNVTAELAMLSALAHANGPRSAEICKKTLQLLVGLDEAQAVLYYDLLFASVGPIARSAMEKMMAQNAFPYQSDLAHRSRALGVAEGKAEGKAEGEAKGKAEAALVFLRVRGVPVSTAERQRILSCHDQDRIDRWLELAATAANSEELT